MTRMLLPLVLFFGCGPDYDLIGDYELNATPNPPDLSVETKQDRIAGNGAIRGCTLGD